VLENLHLNGFIAGGVALASVMRITCVVGKSMLMPVRVLEAIGGFASGGRKDSQRNIEATGEFVSSLATARHALSKTVLTRRSSGSTVATAPIACDGSSVDASVPSLETAMPMLAPSRIHQAR